jgi:Tol biopolymer transport system component/DNA-binding winged helix-turn-helix (wHTH) protein
MSEQISEQQRFYEFDPFLLDARERVLFREAEREPVDLTPKVFDILLELVQNSGRIVEKRELMERVWPNTFVEEANLTQHVSTLRKKLAQNSDKQRFIMTVPGRGYRFVATVRELWDDEEVFSVHETTSSRIIIGDDSRAPQLLEERSQVIIPESRQREIREVSATHALMPTQAVHSHQKRHRIVILAVSVAAIAIAAFVLYKLLGGSAGTPFEKTRLVKFTTTGKVSCAAISPDGKYVAYGIDDGGEGSILIRQTFMTNDGVQIVPSGEVHYLEMTFSPDSNYLYYLRSTLNSPNMLYRIPALGGTPVKLGEDIDSPPAFSPDGKQIAYLRGYPDLNESSLIIANPDGVGERKLASLKEPRERFVLFATPSWSLDGKRIACPVNKRDDKGEYQELDEISVEDGSFKPITSQRWQGVGRAAWLADGRGLMMVAADEESSLSQIWYVAYPTGEARKVTNDLNDYHDLSVTADGRAMTVVQSDRQANIWIVPEMDVTRARQITNSNYDGLQGFSWTPDGRIIYSTQTGAAENLRLSDADGTHQRQLTESAGFSRSAVVSPDGKTIVFVLLHNGEQHLWAMDADGSRLRQLTDGVRDTGPIFSADGLWVIYKSYTFGNPNLFKISLNGGQPVRLTEKMIGSPALSPDGKLIACTYREEALAPNKVALFSVDGGAPLKLLDVNPLPLRGLLRWTRDGQALAYLNIRGGVSNIWLQPIDGGQARPLTDFKQDRIFWFDISPDGRTLAIARGRVLNDVVLINSVK